MTTGTILFNPFTGQPRHPSDIASDPKGLLIWDGKEPLRAVQPSQAGEPPRFPTMLRKMWSGGEVQDWINANWNAAINAKESGK